MKNSFNLSSDEIRVFGGFELFVKEKLHFQIQQHHETALTINAKGL